VTAGKCRWILLLLSALIVPVAANAACAVDARATVSLRIIGGSIFVPVEVNGHTASFILDTGAERSLMTRDATQRLDVARDQWVGTAMVGVGGGNAGLPNADPRSLTLGGVPLVRRTLSHDTSLTVAVLPRTHAGNQIIDGLLGRDYLSLFDLDLDMPSRTLTLYQVHDCAGRFLPWHDAYATVPVSILDRGKAVLLSVMVDGTPLRAMLDSGADSSLLGKPGIFHLGLTQDSWASDPAVQVAGIGPRPVTMHRHRFRSLRVGNQTIESPEIWVQSEPLPFPILDMILGVDWLAGQRIWISFATRQLFVATR
jgi:hypothetical protein